MQPNDAPRYVTLRDYLRVVRQHRLLIVLIALAFAGAAYAISDRQTPSYVAEASLSFDAATREADQIGVVDSSGNDPTRKATLNAKLVDSPAVINEVKRSLRTRLSESRLQAAVRGFPEAQSDLVIIEARADDPAFAARLANASARAVRARLVAQERKRLEAAAATLRKRLRTFSKRARDSFSRAVFAERIARLEALADVTEPVQIARRAEIPATPVSPKPVRNAVLAALLGLVLGLVAAFLRDTLDRRLRGASEIEKEFELPLLGRVSEEALGRIAFSGNGSQGLSPPDVEAFRILRANMQFVGTNGPTRSILVTSPLPEEGKSTVAASLAATNVAAGKRTLLIEADLRRPTLAARLGVAAEPGLTDHLVGNATVAEVLQTVVLPLPDDSNGSAANGSGAAHQLVCVTAGSRSPRPAELLGSKRMHDFLAAVSQTYEVVVVDTSPILPVSDTLELLHHVDSVLLCVRSSSTTRDEARAAKSALEHAPGRAVGLVLTGVRRGDELDYGYYSYDYS